MPNSRKKLGTALENRVVAKAQAKGLKARKQPLSGVLKDYPADVVIDDRVLGECKVRTATRGVNGERYYPLDLNWLDKVIGEAERSGFDFGVVVLQPKSSRKQYAMVELDTLLSLILMRS